MNKNFPVTPYPWGNEHFILRAACAEDAPILAELITQAWPDEEGVPHQIANVVNLADHLTVVAEHDGRPVGFLDNFLTNTPAGPRFEVDLLAVSPLYRGRHLGEKMVQASLQSAGKITSRALIQISNIASQTTFARCKFINTNQVHRLYVSSEKFFESIQATPQANLIKVVTLSYTGIWLENSFTLQDLLAARQTIGKEITLAGAVVPGDLKDACHMAEQCGYHFVAEYQWWKKEGNNEID